MKPDCRNDCVEPLLFPKKPNNRPGLSHIGYRIGTYSDFREALLRNLNKDSILAAWTHREPDDPGIALLEGASILGDILTFYQELYTNEAYLRTAQWRESIADLIRLLGYRLSPGVGGRATFAFEVKGEKSVVIPAGFPIKTQVEELEQAADFETSDEAVAIPSLSKFNLYRPTHIPNFPTEVSVFSIETSQLEQAGIEINEKDRLMLLKSDSEPTNDAQIVIVNEVEQQFDRTNITIEGTWNKGNGLNEIKAFKLGRTFRHFGHNAPPQIVQVDSSGNPSQKNITYNRKLHSQTETTGNTTITPSFTSTQIPLDSEVEGLAIGSKLIIEGVAFHDATIVQQIEVFRSASMTWGALSGATTIVTIDDDMDDLRFSHSHSTTDIRKLVIHETIGNPLILENTLQINPSADGSELYFFGDAVSYKQLNNRRLAFLKEDETFLKTTVATQNTDLSEDEVETLRSLNLASSLENDLTLDDFPLDEPKVTVYGNLVEANQGKTEKKAVLGNGDSRQILQTFKLPKAPLTYHKSVFETPPEVPELQIYVNDRLWERVPSFFSRKPDEEIYIVREDAENNSWVQFGDGKTGKRLPSGIKNVMAKYRTGTGAFGALKEETTVQAGGKLNRLDKIQLPDVVSGGSEPESGEKAREAAPGKIQSLDRLVSLKDFETEALALSGVSKVIGVWGIIDNIPTVEVTVLMETGRDKEFKTVKDILNDYNRCRGPQRFPIKVEQGKLQYIYIAVEVQFDQTFREELVREDIKEALGVSGEKVNGVDGSQGLFSLGQRSFGQNEYAKRIEGIIQNVEGVLWTRVTGLVSLGESENPSELNPPEVKPLDSVIPCDNQHVLRLYTEHLHVSTVSIPSTEIC